MWVYSGGVPCWAEAAASSKQWLWPLLILGYYNNLAPSDSSLDPVAREEEKQKDFKQKVENNATATSATADIWAARGLILFKFNKFPG